MIDEFEAAELAAAMLGRPAPDDDADVYALCDALLEEFNLDWEQLATVAEKLMPLIAVGTVLSGRTARGFARDGAFICKIYDKEEPAS